MGHIIIGTAIVYGILVAIGGINFMRYGGSFASARTRERMQEWGSDIENKRLRDFGLEPEENKKGL